MKGWKQVFEERRHKPLHESSVSPDLKTKRIYLRHTFLHFFDIIFQTVIPSTEGVVFQIELRNYYGYKENYKQINTIVKPTNMSLTKIEILIGSSKLPRVTALTANLD